MLLTYLLLCVLEFLPVFCKLENVFLQRSGLVFIKVLLRTEIIVVTQDNYIYIF